jgi:competence protein ComEC
MAALAASFASGIMWAHSFLPSTGLHWFLVGAATCVLIGLILLRAGWGRTAVGLALASMVFTGFAAARRWEQRFPFTHVRYLESLGADLNDPVRLRGRVVSTPYRTGYALQFDVEAQRVESHTHVYPVTGKIRLRVLGTDDREPWDGSGPVEIRFGDEIQSLVRLRKPHIYLSPGSFDFRRWMEDIEDLYWIGTVKNPRSVQKLGHAPGFRFAEFAEHARQRLLRGIDDMYSPWSVQGRYGAVLKAVLWGDRTALDSTTIEDFRKTGLYHLLVIAGLHVGLLTLLLEFLLRALGFRRVVRALLVLGFLAVYAFLVEQRAPTLRATLMIGLYLAARLLDRRHSPLNAIGTVALILLYVRPAWLFESGFQLSFSAALLIVGVAVPILERTTEPYRLALRRLDDILLDDRFSPRLAQARLDLRSLVQALRRRVGFFRQFPSLSRNLIVLPLRLAVWTANILIFSAVLQLGLLLPMVETFHRVTFAGVGLNALAIPVMTVLLALSLPINLLSVVSPAAATVPAKVLSLIMAALFNMTHLPGLVAWLSYRVPAPPPWVAWGFCGAFVLAGVALTNSPRFVGPGPEPPAPALGRWKLRSALAGCAVFVALVAAHPFAPRLSRGVQQMTALDCGQGDAFFLALPGGTTMLLGAGGSRTRGARESNPQGRRWDSGEDIVSPYLWSLGIKRIDVVLLTGTRPDQLEGLSAILENFLVGEFWHPPQPETPEYAALLEAVAERGIPTRTLMAGDAISLADATIRVLWPLPDSDTVAGTIPGNVAPGFSPASARTFSLAFNRAGLKAGATSAGRVSGRAGMKADSTLLHGNDDSLVMRISAEGMNFLLRGDAGDDAEEKILASGEPLESQVLEAAHYGSKSLACRDFVARVDPSVVIVSSGAAVEVAGVSPNPQMAKVLESSGARVFHTNTDGATTVEWDGHSLRVRTFGNPQGMVIAEAGRPPVAQQK